MKSPIFGGRSRSSTEKSAETRNSSGSSSSALGKKPVKSAARSVAGALLACFSPPEPDRFSSKEFNESSASTSGSEKRRSSNLFIYNSSNNSTHDKEPGSIKFTMNEILKATKRFSPTFKIGQGGFGTVYKATLQDGGLVAVKRAKKTLHDKNLGREFQTEVQILAQVEHLNLVKFFGFLEHEDERIIVVEYVPNGTLREHLDCLTGSILGFTSRLDIAIDVAHALTYLHTYTDRPIIHRDIKSSNILLTENLRAKVADFGLARLVGDSESGDSYVSTMVKGTAGYLDPEYMKTNHLTEKSDVYSFGILLVELVTSRRPIEPKRELRERITAKWALKKFIKGDAILVLDPRLERSSLNNFALEKILELSLQCLATDRNNRPPMRKCAEILWSIRKEYKELLTSDAIPLSIHS